MADPYRWLEDGDAPEVRAWVEAQNARTRQALDARPDRRAWLERLVVLLGLPVSTAVRLAGGNVFALERGGGQKQFTLVVRPSDDPRAPARLLVDPAALTDDATAAIDWYHPACDGTLVAYGVSEGGDERSVLRVLDVDSGRHLDDEIPDTRAASVAWLPDGGTFLYTRYPEGDEYNRKVFRHELGRIWKDDELVWDALPNPEAWASVDVSPDGRFTLVTTEVGWIRTDVHLHDSRTGTWRTLIEGRRGHDPGPVRRGPPAGRDDARRGSGPCRRHPAGAGRRPGELGDHRRRGPRRDPPRRAGPGRDPRRDHGARGRPDHPACSGRHPPRRGGAP